MQHMLCKCVCVGGKDTGNEVRLNQNTLHFGLSWGIPTTLVLSDWFWQCAEICLQAFAKLLRVLSEMWMTTIRRFHTSPQGFPYLEWPLMISRAQPFVGIHNPSRYVYFSSGDSNLRENCTEYKLNINESLCPPEKSGTVTTYTCELQTGYGARRSQNIRVTYLRTGKSQVACKRSSVLWCVGELCGTNDSQ